MSKEYSLILSFKPIVTTITNDTIILFYPILRTVPPFVTARTFWASRGIRVQSYGICLLIQQYSCAVNGYVEKADLSKGYQNPKWKLRVTTHFSEIIELKFGKKLPCLLCILTSLHNYSCLILCQKFMVTTHIFLFGFQ